MNQDPQGAARHTDPSTSHEAAERVNVTKLESDILKALEGEKGTTRVIAERSGRERVSVSARMKSLTQRGLVREAGVVYEKGFANMTYELVNRRTA